MLELVKQKRVYPYEYIDSFEKFSEDKLLDRCELFRSLKDWCISEKDESISEKKCANQWKKLFTCCQYLEQIKGDYHDLYLKTDVLLLTDIFKKFINTCLQYYKLDPCHYFSSSGLSWDAMLKITKIEVELFSDIDIHLLFEKGMRGGISYIAKRYSKANNKPMTDYDSREESIYIIYLEANNLYGWAMSQYLPYGGFKWLNK